MYRFYCRTNGCQAARQVFSSIRVTRRAVCTDNNNNNTATPLPKPRRSGIRRVVPSDEEMAELHEVDCEATSATSSRSRRSVLADVTVEPMRFSTARESGMEGCGDGFGDLGADGEDDDAELLQTPGPTVGSAGQPVDPLLAEESGPDGGKPSSCVGGSALSRDIIERQAYVRSLSLPELVEALCLYLRATVNPRLVSAEEEHILFPVVTERLNEFHVDQLLDIVECHWARSTLVRYGTTFKDGVRDRIAFIATAAAKSTSQRPTCGNVSVGHNTVGADAGSIDSHEEDDAVYTHEVEQEVTDLIILRAAEEMSPETVLRCIVVMGMSAGRRKRDLQFFQAMGMFLVHHINHYKDPHDLVRVLTAFARAKIVPPKRFLALLGRRFAVLNKRKKLGALPSYRAFVNLYKMGHDQMNSLRFLADCIFETFDSNIKLEKKRMRLAQLQGNSNVTATAAAEDVEADRGESSGTPGTSKSVTAGYGEAELGATSTEERTSTDLVGDLDPHLLQNLKVRERFKRLTELKPSMFTKLLLVLARFGAPHQQYLRPTVVPLILPTLREFPPPSFTRLLRAMSLFKTSDLDLIEPVIEFMAEDLGPCNVLPEDVLQMVRLVAPPDVPVPRNLVKLISLCEVVYSNSATPSLAAGANDNGARSSDLGGTANTACAIRPADMCAVAAVLLKIQMKDDVPLEALDPLTRLMEFFAERMHALMKLHVVSLTHVDVFTDLCRQQQHPDVSGHIAQLCMARRRVNDTEGDEDYYSQLDIDVRETLHRILIVNDFNTYGQYRPTPGVLQVDFKQALTTVSAFDVLEAADLFAQAFPNAMKPTVERHLSRSIISKLDGGGEEVITEENNVVLRPPRELLLTREDLVKFVSLLQRTPLRRVQSSPVVWRFVEEKARRLSANHVLEIVEKRRTNIC